MDYMDFKVSKHPNVLDVPEAEIGSTDLRDGLDQVETPPWWLTGHLGRRSQAGYARLPHERGSLR